jgi:hypothetical protein
MSERPALSSVSISDTSLSEQADVRNIKPQKDLMQALLKDLENEEEKVLIRTCDMLAHGTFIPWLNKQNRANKLYFAKRGGVTRCVKLMKEHTSVEARAYVGTALWNFAESGEMYAILWEHGAVDALLGFLKSNVPRLQYVAIGALFGLLDYDSSTGAHLVDYDKDLIKEIIDTSPETATWSFRLAKTGCLLSLAKHPTTRNELLSLRGLNTFKEDNTDILLNYLNALGLAHLLAGSNNSVSGEEREEALSLISKQFQKQPREIRQKESAHGVVWTSTRHLLNLIKDEDVTLRHFGLFCYANLSYGDYNRSLMLDEDVLDTVRCAQWQNDGEFDDRKNLYLDIILKNYAESPVPVPTLFHICLHNIHFKIPQLEHKVAEFFPYL